MAADETSNAAAPRQAAAAPKLVCESCGVPYGRYWSTASGKVVLCPTCAQMHGMGCP